MFLECLYAKHSKTLLSPSSVASTETAVFVELLKLAIHYRMDNLLDDVSRVLAKRLSDANVLDVWKVLIEESASIRAVGASEDAKRGKQEDRSCLHSLCPLLFPYLCTVTVQSIAELGGTASLTKVMNKEQLAECVEHLVLKEVNVEKLKKKMKDKETIALQERSAALSALEKRQMTATVKKEVEEESKENGRKAKDEQDDRDGLSSEEKIAANKLIRKLMKEPDADMFKRPIDPKKDGVPAYNEMLKHPMNLKAISQKLRENAYAKLQDVLDDVSLIFSNAITYSSANSFIAKCATAMDASFKEIWEELRTSYDLLESIKPKDLSSVQSKEPAKRRGRKSEKEKSIEAKASKKDDGTKSEDETQETTETKKRRSRRSSIKKEEDKSEKKTRRGKRQESDDYAFDDNDDNGQLAQNERPLKRAKSSNADENRNESEALKKVTSETGKIRKSKGIGIAHILNIVWCLKFARKLCLYFITFRIFCNCKNVDIIPDKLLHFYF